MAQILAQYSFVSDNSTPEFRTVRLAMMGFAFYVGVPLGIVGGAWLYEEGGYRCIYANKFLLIGIVFLLYIVRLWNFEENVVKKRKDKIARGEHVVRPGEKGRILLESITNVITPLKAQNDLQEDDPPESHQELDNGHHTKKEEPQEDNSDNLHCQHAPAGETCILHLKVDK